MYEQLGTTDRKKKLAQMLMAQAGGAPLMPEDETAPPEYMGKSIPDRKRILQMLMDGASPEDVMGPNGLNAPQPNDWSGRSFYNGNQMPPPGVSRPIPPAPITEHDTVPPEYFDEFKALNIPDRKRILQLLMEGTPPDEAFAPEGYSPQEMIAPDQAPFRLPPMTTGGGSDDIKGGEGDDMLRYGSEKLTEAQSKDVGYYRRGYAANQALSDPGMEQALTQYTDTFATNFGGVGRMFQDEQFQLANRAAQEFLAVILRKDTGAAITNEEFRMYGPMYLPRPGDKPAVIEAKRRARAEALSGLEMGLGTAGPLAGIARSEVEQNRKPPDVSNMSDDELMRILTGK